MNLSQRILENLQRPRPVTDQVTRMLTYRWEIAVDGEAVLGFFADQFPTLDEFEQEDLLAPLYTPGFAEKRSVTPYLADEKRARPADWISLLLEETISAKPIGSLLVEDSHNVEIPLPESVIDRYLGLLGMDRVPGDKLATLVRNQYIDQAGDEILTQMRERAWKSEPARDFLARWLDAQPEPAPTAEEVGFLTEWLGSHPLNAIDFQTLSYNLTEWCEAHQKARSPFFNDLIGTVDDAAQRRAEGMVVQTKHACQTDERLALASRLADRLGALSLSSCG